MICFPKDACWVSNEYISTDYWHMTWTSAAYSRDLCYMNSNFTVKVKQFLCRYKLSAFFNI